MTPEGLYVMSDPIHYTQNRLALQLHEKYIIFSWLFERY